MKSMLPSFTSSTGFSGLCRSGVSCRTSLIRRMLAREMLIITTTMETIIRLISMDMM